MASASPLRLLWSQLRLPASPASEALQRSSNSVAVVGKQLYVFGGERLPRQPVDDELWVVDLEDGSISAAPTQDKRPSPRVGAAIAYDSRPGNEALYVWGGRESQDMTPCDLTLWKYAPKERKWESVATAEAANADTAVEGRSYHAMCLAAGELYLHAGCPAKGRLASLHSLALDKSSTWTDLPSSPAPARGGTVLTPITLPSNGELLLVRYGGFAGYELGGTLDYFSPSSGTWSSIKMPGEEFSQGHPGARSVHALVPVNPPIALPEGHVVAIMLFGERGPAPAHLGHLGAGTFHRDAWALLAAPSAGGSSGANPHGFKWVEIQQEAKDNSHGDGKMPAARGWFGADWSSELGKVVVQGGLDDSNERLGDVWIGEVKIGRA
ncbi:Kelch repeat containing protein [Mycena chlorophos]|uniref:Kelch repeat containing protein n=1 Tax=Mycena chlorophos TaxID=658473 RepID=A0A8H6TMN1_MYCCL|nr:Kelch repeat containing protein [Mycena chlorophos]